MNVATRNTNQVAGKHLPVGNLIDFDAPLLGTAHFKCETLCCGLPRVGQHLLVVIILDICVRKCLCFVVGLLCC